MQILIKMNTTMSATLNMQRISNKSRDKDKNGAFMI